MRLKLNENPDKFYHSFINKQNLISRDESRTCKCGNCVVQNAWKALKTFWRKIKTVQQKLYQSMAAEN